jgi:hypothetical protein
MHTVPTAQGSDRQHSHGYKPSALQCERAAPGGPAANDASKVTKTAAGAARCRAHCVALRRSNDARDSARAKSALDSETGLGAVNQQVVPTERCTAG